MTEILEGNNYYYIEIPDISESTGIIATIFR